MNIEQLERYHYLLQKKVNLLIEMDIEIDVDWYSIYWFKRAKGLTVWERRLAEVDSEILRIQLKDVVFLN